MNDCPVFKELVDKTSQNFSIFEVSADKAYSSRQNIRLVDSYDATPYIPFKSNSVRTSKGCRKWRKMWLYFELNREGF